MARVAVRASSCCATTLPSLKPPICVCARDTNIVLLVFQRCETPQCDWRNSILLSDVCFEHLKLAPISDSEATFSPPVPNLCLNHRAFTVESAESELQKSDEAFFHQQLLHPKPLLRESGVVTPDSSVMPPSESEIVQGMLGRWALR